jgi:dTDP-4-dehydrorhamnose reductase
MKQNVLLIGSSGFLGKSLYKHLSSNFEIVPTHTANPVFEHSERYDFFQDDLHVLLEKYIPEIIVMAAAVEKDVDAELFRTRVRHFVEICHSHRLIYLSSDAVFDGKKGYYSETDLPSPNNSLREKSRVLRGGNQNTRSELPYYSPELSLRIFYGSPRFAPSKNIRTARGW